MIAGFIYSQILTAFVQAGLIEFLNGHLRRFDEIADFTALHSDAADRLLRAGQSLQIAESPQPGLWTLGESTKANAVMAATLPAHCGSTAAARRRKSNSPSSLPYREHIG